VVQIARIRVGEGGAVDDPGSLNVQVWMLISI
jgi:hypothetical protein